MNSTFRRANQLLSVLIVVIGVVLLWNAAGDGGMRTNVQGALGVVLVVYGIVRYVAWWRYGSRGE